MNNTKSIVDSSIRCLLTCVTYIFYNAAFYTDDAKDKTVCDRQTRSFTDYKSPDFPLIDNGHTRDDQLQL
jgi:hypothetical protein